MQHLSPDFAPVRVMIAQGFDEPKELVTVYEERKFFGESRIKRTRACPVRNAGQVSLGPSLSWQGSVNLRRYFELTRKVAQAKIKAVLYRTLGRIAV